MHVFLFFYVTDTKDRYYVIYILIYKMYNFKLLNEGNVFF